MRLDLPNPVPLPVSDCKPLARSIQCFATLGSRTTQRFRDGYYIRGKLYIKYPPLPLIGSLRKKKIRLFNSLDCFPYFSCAISIYFLSRVQIKKQISPASGIPAETASSEPEKIATQYRFDRRFNHMSALFRQCKLY